MLELCFSTVTAPKMVVDLLAEKKTISYQGCMAQIDPLNHTVKVHSRIFIIKWNSYI